jgi:succinoglycan biosynthesis transport protein ExoP
MDPLKKEPVRTLAPLEPQAQTLDMPRTQVVYGEPGTLGPTAGLTEYWRILLKRRWTVLATALAMLVVVTIATLRTTPLYEATARIAISQNENDGIGISSQNANPDYAYDYNMELDTQAKILQSDTLALNVINALGLSRNPKFAGKLATTSPDAEQALTVDPAREAKLLDIWRENISVSKIQRTRMIEIRFTSPDPKLAAQIVNSLASAYVENNFKTRFESTMQASEWLQNQLNDLQIKVEKSQEALVKFQRENNVVGLDDKQNTIVTKLDDLNKEATAAQADRVIKEAQYQLTRSGNLDALPELSANSLIQDFRRQEADLRRQLAQATVQFGPSYPKVIELNNQLLDIQATIRNEVDRIVSRKAAEYRAAVARESMLQSALSSQTKAVSSLNEKAIEYFALKRESDTNRNLYEGLLTKLKEAAVTSGLKSSNVRVVDVARPPDRPSKPNIPRNVVMGLMLGVVGGISLAFILEALDNTVRTPDQVELISGLPSLGIIPLSLGATGKAQKAQSASLLPVKQDSKQPRNTEMAMVAHHRPKSEVAESYRALRTSILLSSIGSAPKVLMLTSALPQEGKTTTSVNTAIVLAQKGGRVLLIDADMRRPSIHQSLKIRNRTGLSNVLSGNATPEEAIVVSPVLPNLFVLPAGPPPPHPAEMLGSSVMKNYLAQWREQFDHIVIDTPPVLSVTDAVLLSVDADAVVLVIRSGRTTKEALRRSRELLTQVNSRLMGVVVNAVDLQSPEAYYYYYGSHYGGGYYEESADQRSGH